MRYQELEDMKKSLQGVVEFDGRVRVLDKDKLRGEAIDRLVFNGVFHENAEVKQAARNVVRQSAKALGILDEIGVLEGDVTGAAEVT